MSKSHSMVMEFTEAYALGHDPEMNSDLSMLAMRNYRLAKRDSNGLANKLLQYLPKPQRAPSDNMVRCVQGLLMELGEKYFDKELYLRNIYKDAKEIKFQPESFDVQITDRVDAAWCPRYATHKDGEFNLLKIRVHVQVTIIFN